MRRILILGAGRSSFVLINYLLSNASSNYWFVTVGDYSKEGAQEIVQNNKYGEAIFFDVNNTQQRNQEISQSDIVVSMLPARMHILVAKTCVDLRKHLVTASYVSKEIQQLAFEAKSSNIILLNEMGLDPGIDHMSAMHIIDNLKKDQFEIQSFKSYCGGLIPPKIDDNPWHYKFTWNPRNVVLDGQGVAQYIKNGKYKYIPYNQLFLRTDDVNVLNLGVFEGYANRDSLSYRRRYGLDNIPTLLRGTLRRKGFCKSWDMFVQLGLTDDTYTIVDDITYREFINLFLPYDKNLSVEEKFCDYFSISKDSTEFKKVEWLGLFLKNKINLDNVTPAKILQHILEKKWMVNDNDKDMIVMQHQFEFLEKNKLRKLSSSLVVFGENDKDTAMAKTVGLPVAIATKLILNGKINSVGVQIPTTKEIYAPVLRELKDYGVNFIEKLV